MTDGDRSYPYDKVYWRSTWEREEIHLLAKSRGYKVSTFIRDTMMNELRQSKQGKEIEQRKIGNEVPPEFKEVDTIGPIEFEEKEHGLLADILAEEDQE